MACDVRRLPKTSVAVSAAVEVELRGAVPQRLAREESESGSLFHTVDNSTRDFVLYTLSTGPF